MGLLSKVMSILKDPGDTAEARITPSNRKVIKIRSQGEKYSAVKYPSGTVVETRTTRPKKKSR